MASFIENLWNSIFTPGPTPTLLIATNATFAALQVLLFVLLVATYSIHFVILSVLSGGLWWSINWFAAELNSAKAKEEEAKKKDQPRSADKHDTIGSDTETEEATPQPVPEPSEVSTSSLKPQPPEATLRKRQSLGDSSGYISTDSEWEKVDDEKER